MSSKYIIIAGQQIPIVCDAPVKTFDQPGNPSFYDIMASAGPEKAAQFAQTRPNGRSYSMRKGLRLDVGQLRGIPPEELDRMRDHVIQVVLHHDVTPTSEKCFSVLISRGLSTHFMINHDGTLYQALDVYHASWATGPNNDRCIAIDLNNPVQLEFAKNDPANPPRSVFQGKINGPMKVALGYTDAQYATLIALFRAFITPLKIDAKTYWIPMRAMAQRFFPPLNAEGQVIDRLIADHVNFVGFMGHWHCEAQKWDPGPGFDWFRVLAGIHGERNSFPVLLEDGSNLADLQGDALTAQLEQYYNNIESSETGGWYPIGANQSWHSGIHLHVDKDKPVLAIAKGTIVAVRNGKRVDLGDPGFVVIRHEMTANVQAVGDAEEPEPLYWWSVYMHLGRMESPEMLGAVPWVNTLLQGNIEAPEDDPYDLEGFGDATPRAKMIPRTADGTQPAKFDPQAFWDGDIILTNIPVDSGETLGFVGEFGANEWSLEPQVHIEVISAKNLFDRETNAEAARDWVLQEGDKDDDSLISIDKVIAPILKQSIEFEAERARRVVKTSEIQAFFLDSSMTVERERFRRTICFHKSEWSPKTDWRRTAASAVGWQWETQEAFSRWLMTWVPFRWMTEEVTSHCKFPPSHHFFTYHPIYFLDVLNRSYAGGGQTAQGVSDRELTEAQAEAAAIEARLSDYQNRLATGQELTPEEQAEYDELLAIADRHFGSEEASVFGDDAEWKYDGSFDMWEPGEWDPPKVRKDDEPF